MTFQLTRPVWGEPVPSPFAHGFFFISTHSPRVGRTISSSFNSPASFDFNSLAPCGANQGYTEDLFWAALISTHSPRVGRTIMARRYINTPTNFNSLAPCGANRYPLCRQNTFRDFNSLAPCGANPACRTLFASSAIFQLTRPVWGEPLSSTSGICNMSAFQLTRPVWGEPSYQMLSRLGKVISTHSPRVGRTSARL